MSFITKEDILKEIREEEIEAIIREDDSLVEFAMDAAVAEMKSYLAAVYDTETIFSKTGSDRHSLLVNFAVDMAIYVLLSNCFAGQNMEDRRARYKRATDWLSKINKGELEADLPVLTSDDENKTTRGAVGEHSKRDNYW